ncbi:MAG: heme oxygenase [Planctomycetota bacterium]|nr:MAG: heme oxygenase [Planctomycetota bacterium]
MLIFEKELSPYRDKLKNHDLYSNIKDIFDLRIFMEAHVFAVWDFMSLIKALQIKLTCISLPWKPSGNRFATRLINEIVLVEESDFNQEQLTMSHFEMYLEAMAEAGADTSKIEIFLHNINSNLPSSVELKNKDMPQPLKDFVGFSFDIIKKDDVSLIASVFAFGREVIIPEMFIEIVEKIKLNSDVKIDKFIFYLQRHIQIDGDVHNDMALNLVKDLCADDKHKLNQALIISKEAMEKRISLWDFINQKIIEKNRILSNNV